MKLQEPPTIFEYAGVVIGFLSILAIIYLAVVVENPGAIPVLTGVVGAATGTFYSTSLRGKNLPSGGSTDTRPTDATPSSPEVAPRA